MKMSMNYLTKIIYKDTNIYLIWYSDDKDGFLIYQNRLLMFHNIDDARIFVKEQKISLEEEMAIFDLSKIGELLNNIDLSENCRNLINIWNFFADLANSLNEDFVGNYEEKLILDIYYKLFYGSNLEMLRNEEYHPKLCDEEKQKCFEIFFSGLSLVDRLFAFAGIR